jgi:hypothetical protein
MTGRKKVVIEDNTSDFAAVDNIEAVIAEVEKLSPKARAAQLPRIIRAIAEALK